MLPTDRKKLGDRLPAQLSYPAFKDRDAAWLLHQRMGEQQRIADLGNSPLAPLMNRPAIRAVTSRCGDGCLYARDLLPLADPLTAFEPDQDIPETGPVEAAWAAMMAADTRWFTVSFATWPDLSAQSDWREMQVSRQGCNLVLQVNFPDTHQQAFYRVFNAQARRAIEYAGHPVRTTGPITMAWARLDFDPDGKELLIEELQTDWLRVIRNGRAALQGFVAKSERDRARAYIDETVARYKDWAQVTLLAALAFSVTELGIRRIWLHQPETGARLKNIRHEYPPRSLYTDLPRRFGFRPTVRAPSFLYATRHGILGRMRRRGVPLFWHLDLDAQGPLVSKGQNTAG